MIQWSWQCLSWTEKQWGGSVRVCCTFYEASALLHGDLDRATWGFLGWLSQEWVILDRTRRKHCIFWSIFRSSTLASLQYAVAYTSLPSVVLEGAAQKHYYQEARIVRDYHTSYQNQKDTGKKIYMGTIRKFETKIEVVLGNKVLLPNKLSIIVLKETLIVKWLILSNTWAWYFDNFSESQIFNWLSIFNILIYLK